MNTPTANITLQEILAILASMKTIPALEGHASSLEGPRTRGSTTLLGLERLLDGGVGELRGEQFSPAAGGIPGCRYFHFPILSPEKFGAKLGAVALATIGDLTTVRVRFGSHGYEMYLDISPEETDMPPAYHVTVIMGPDNTGSLPEIVWTWHPGDPLGNSKPGIGPDSGVKVHNG